jgi:organic radical activating enzyme
MADLDGNYKRHVIEIKEQVDAISPSFCAAKWKQVTMHLQNGHTHSCHHPKTHKVPVEELAFNPSALHNTNFKKEQRQMMLDGERPSECDYCWRVEDSEKDNNVYSDRYTKSADSWAAPYISEIASKPWDDNVDPSYVEVAFSSVCNFKCSYCSPDVSSKWMEEIERFGPYPTSTNYNNLDNIIAQDKMPISNKDYNPYVESFWKWFPDMYQNLRTFRITGGEPLLAKDTFQVLDHIIENPNPELELNINSNLCIPDELLKKFVEKLKRIQGEGMIKEFKLYTSAEAHGKRAEYIRNGLDYNKWFENCHTILRDIPQSKLTVMSTYNALSVTSYIPFMDDILSLRNTYNTGADRRNPVSLDTPYLRWPWHQTVFILTKDYIKQIEDQVTYMYRNKEHMYWPPLCGYGFYEHEINRMERLFYVARDEKTPELDLNRNRKDFAIFVDEHDKRRGTDFVKTFPEMEEFYRMCKEIK